MRERSVIDACVLGLCVVLAGFGVYSFEKSRLEENVPEVRVYVQPTSIESATETVYDQSIMRMENSR